MHAVRHLPPLMAYCTTPGLLDDDLVPKRVNACAVLAALCDPPAFADALVKYAKVSAKTETAVLVAKTLRACHEAVRGRPRVLDDPTDTAWAAAVPHTDWSIIMEMFGHRLDTGETPMMLHVPCTANSLKKCLRDAPWTMLRAPPICVLSLKRLPTHPIEFVDYATDMTLCDTDYRLRAIMCTSGIVMASAGHDAGWVLYQDDGTTHPLLDTNMLITKDAAILMYSRS